MEREQILKELKKHGVKITEGYFKPSKTECSAFEQLLKVIDKQAKQLENKPLNPRVPLEPINKSPLEKIKVI